jgi:DNA-binding transcriptional LysR family regulator
VVHSVLCASPRYLALHGTPTTIADLANHKCLQVALPIFPSDRWVLAGPDGVHEYRLPDGRFKVNISDAMAVAVQEGMGIGAIPMQAVSASLRNGSLIRVLPDYHLQRLNLYAIYASRQYLDAKIKTWVDFLRGWIVGALNTDELGIGHAIAAA